MQAPGTQASSTSRGVRGMAPATTFSTATTPALHCPVLGMPPVVLQARSCIASIPARPPLRSLSSVRGPEAVRNPARLCHSRARAPFALQGDHRLPGV